MGRYYYGDIDGKFWFGVQSSEAPLRFGAEEREVWYYDEDEEQEVLDDCNVEYILDNVEKVNSELSNIENYLGIDKIKKMEDFFNSIYSYSDKMLQENDIAEEELVEYADYTLGKKILECMLNNGKGTCSFTAEL